MLQAGQNMGQSQTAGKGIGGKILPHIISKFGPMPSI
jgi:hypothetical protein